jgi:hypothetical protein
MRPGRTSTGGGAGIDSISVANRETDETERGFNPHPLSYGSYTYWYEKSMEMDLHNEQEKERATVERDHEAGRRGTAILFIPLCIQGREPCIPFSPMHPSHHPSRCITHFSGAWRAMRPPSIIPLPPV